MQLPPEQSRWLLSRGIYLKGQALPFFLQLLCYRVFHSNKTKLYDNHFLDGNAIQGTSYRLNIYSSGYFENAHSPEAKLIAASLLLCLPWNTMSLILILASFPIKKAHMSLICKQYIKLLYVLDLEAPMDFLAKMTAQNVLGNSRELTTSNCLPDFSES